MQCVTTVNMPCSSTVVKSLYGFSYVFHFHYRVDHCRLCNDNHDTLYLTSRQSCPVEWNKKKLHENSYLPMSIIAIWSLNIVIGIFY